MIRKFIVLSCIIGLSSYMVLPQVHGKIEGFVGDINGNPLQRVAITITSLKASSMFFELSTDKEGKFIQVGLWLGYYQISFKKSGFLPASLEAKVSIGESTKLNIKLEKAEELMGLDLSQADKLFIKGNKLYEKKKYEEAATLLQNRFL